MHGDGGLPREHDRRSERDGDLRRPELEVMLRLCPLVGLISRRFGWKRCFISSARGNKWRLRRFLKRKHSTPRGLAQSSGLMEWSDREIARLKPSWARRFIRRPSHPGCRCL